MMQQLKLCRLFYFHESAHEICIKDSNYAFEVILSFVIIYVKYIEIQIAVVSDWYWSFLGDRIPGAFYWFLVLEINKK